MIYQLSGEYYVRALQERDLAGPYPSWFEDQEACKYNSHGKFFKSASWFRAFYDGLNREDQVLWAICHEVDGHIGNISLQDLSFINRSGEFAVLLGDRRHWGKGVGFQAARRLLDHGFAKLNLERVNCGTAATNVSMRKLAERLGMVQEGCRRGQLYLEGQRVDLIEYGASKAEFAAAVDETR